MNKIFNGVASEYDFYSKEELHEQATKNKMVRLEETRIDFAIECNRLSLENAKLQSQIDEVKEYLNKEINELNEYIKGYEYATDGYHTKIDKRNSYMKILSKLELNVPIIANSDVLEEVGK